MLALLAILPALASTTPTSTTATSTPAKSDHPLLELARQLERTRDATTHGAIDRGQLREARHLLDRAQAPADADCANSIGAARYANLYIELAGAQASAGDFPGAADSYRHAHACRPHDADILGALAGVLFDARDYPGTREAITASLEIDPRSVGNNRLAGNLDFVEEHWADAIARFRYVAASDDDRRQAGYGQLMYWLAQRRAGVLKPEFVERTPGEGWPQPLLLFMRGQYTEAELLAPIDAGDADNNMLPNTSTDERLVEALFYVGEEYWARGQRDVARDYFTALVNIKVLYFLEHGIALAEIAKLR